MMRVGAPPGWRPATARWAAVALSISLAAYSTPGTNGSGPSGALRDSTPVYLLAFPQPGPSRPGELPPEAAKLQQEAAVKAKAADWGAALDLLHKARHHAHCAPSLIYNLGLAYEGKGDVVTSAMFLRAYLAAMPDAPDAASVRAEVERIKRRVADAAERFADQAEQLAAVLDAAPPSGDGVSLRAGAYDYMIGMYYTTGRVARGDALLAKLRALPAMAAFPEPLQRRDAGVFMAMFRDDPEAAGKATRYRAEYLAGIYAHRGDAESAALALRGGVDLDYPIIGNLANDLKAARAYEALWIVDRARLGKLSTAFNMTNSRSFDGIVDDMETVFADGRPDIAEEMARALVTYFRKQPSYDVQEQPRYLEAVALLGERDRLEKELHDGDVAYMPIGDLAFILGATRPASEAMANAALIDRLSDEAYTKRAKRLPSGVWFPRQDEVYAVPAGIRAVLVGDAPKALSLPGRFEATNPERYWEQLFSFAVATGRSDLALALADRVDSDKALYQLHRLAAWSGSPAVRTKLAALEASACQGWRPRDAAQAQGVWSALRAADEVAGDPHYARLDDDVKKVAQEKPETLPKAVLNKALDLYIAGAYLDR